jgi:L-threonylcarbamoyladenylate synthase
LTPKRTLLLGTAEAADLESAVSLLMAGALVAVPTETVYGLAADASNDAAVRAIFAAKGRPTSHPLIVHVADFAHARRLSRAWSPVAEILARSFWPGPLSILTTRADSVSSVVTGGRDTVVLRVPDQPATLHILRAMHEQGSIGVAAPSANRFGSISPTTASHVLADLDGRIDAVVDGGPCSVGVESTIVDCTHEPAIVLRPGGVPIEQIASCLAEHGLTVAMSPDVAGTIDESRAIAPGMLRSHYAPRTRLVVVETDEEVEVARRAAEARGECVVLLPHPTDVYEYSRDLYALLRGCDEAGADLIVGSLPSSVGLGAAVRDRLLKAAAER